MCSLDDPAVSVQTVFAFDAFTGNVRCNNVLARIASASSIVAVFVTISLSRSFLGRRSKPSTAGIAFNVLNHVGLPL